MQERSGSSKYSLIFGFIPRLSALKENYSRSEEQILDLITKGNDYFTEDLLKKQSLIAALRFEYPAYFGIAIAGAVFFLSSRVLTRGLIRDAKKLLKESGDDKKLWNFLSLPEAEKNRLSQTWGFYTLKLEIAQAKGINPGDIDFEAELIKHYNGKSLVHGIAIGGILFLLTCGYFQCRLREELELLYDHEDLEILLYTQMNYRIIPPCAYECESLRSRLN